MTIIDTPECRNDLDEANCIAHLAGLSNAAYVSAIEGAIARLGDLWSEPQAWRALLNLAMSLPQEGSVMGRAC